MGQEFVQWQPRWYTGTDGRAGTTELIVAFRDDAKAPQNALEKVISSLVSPEEANVITCNWEAVFPFRSCSPNSPSSCTFPKQTGVMEIAFDLIYFRFLILLNIYP